MKKFRRCLPTKSLRISLAGRRIVGPALHRRVSEKLTLVGVIPESLEPHIGLTPTVEAMIEPALEQVLAALRESGVEAIPREATHD